MTVASIVDLTSDELEALMFTKRLRAHASVDLDNGTKYAVVLVKLNDAVTPADYPALKAAMVGVTGIQDVSLLFDRQTKAAMAADRIQTLHVTADCQFRVDPPPE